MKGNTMIEATNKNYIIKSLGLEKEETTSSGLIIKAQGETELAEILSVGPDIENPLAVGTKVAVIWQHAIPIILNKERSYVINKENIIGVVNDASN